jgi:predicted RNA binding protein YcfA (HicA-like mRNA interferase family)
LKSRDITKLIERDGWRLKNQEGSHRHYIHPTKPGKVTLVGDPGDDMAEGTVRSILKQAKLTKRDLKEWKKKK